MRIRAVLVALVLFASAAAAGRIAARWAGGLATPIEPALPATGLEPPEPEETPEARAPRAPRPAAAGNPLGWDRVHRRMERIGKIGPRGRARDVGRPSPRRENGAA